MRGKVTSQLTENKRPGWLLSALSRTIGNRYQTKSNPRPLPEAAQLWMVQELRFASY